MSTGIDDLMDDLHPEEQPKPEAVPVPTESDNEKEEEQVSSNIQPVFVPKGKIVGGQPLREDNAGSGEYALMMPSASSATYEGPITDLIYSMGDKAVEGIIQSSWGATSIIGSQLAFARDDYNEALDREDSEWRNGVEHDGKRISIKRPNPKQRKGPITGIHALARVASSARTGQPVNVPLWHTGIWVLISPLSYGEQMNLDAMISSMKVSFGRRTRGRLFSLSDIHLKMPLINAILDHVESTSWISTDKSDLKQVIKMADIQTLIWGMACAVYPNGHQYAHACAASPGKCDHVAKGRIYMPELMRVDNAQISDKQRKHMMLDKVTPAQVEEYQREFMTDGRDQFIVDEKKFELQVPNLAEYEQAGIRWVNDLEKAYESTFGRDADPQRRAEHVASLAELASARQYSHWVKRLVFLVDGEDSEWIEDQDTLVKALEQLSEDDVVMDAYYRNVVTFINRSAVALPGIMNYFCPKCKQKQPTDSGAFEHLIPIDMGSAFFSLARLQLEKKMSTSNI